MHAFELALAVDIQGFGIGGDYPLSASIASEYASTRWRGAFVGTTFAMQARAAAQIAGSAQIAVVVQGEVGVVVKA